MDNELAPSLQEVSKELANKFQRGDKDAADNLRVYRDGFRPDLYRKMLDVMQQTAGDNRRDNLGLPVLEITNKGEVTTRRPNRSDVVDVAR